MADSSAASMGNSSADSMVNSSVSDSTNLSSENFERRFGEFQVLSNEQTTYNCHLPLPVKVFKCSVNYQVFF